MADFNIAYDITMKHEGGYANDSADRGGETYAGVARKFWPEWEGWKTIDALKRYPGFPGNLRKDTLLAEKVRNFYRVNFWGRFGDIESQKVANALFDCAVNCGVVPATKMMQRALDIPDDGIFGKQTLKYINATFEDAVMASFNAERERYYRRIAERDPSQKKFLAGWLSRISKA